MPTNEEQLLASGWFYNQSGQLTKQDFGSTLLDGNEGVGAVAEGEHVEKSPDASAIRNQQLLLANMARTERIGRAGQKRGTARLNKV